MNGNHQNISLVIFDCDGVLVDSEILSQRVLLSILAQFGVDVDSHYFYEHFLGRSFENVLKVVERDFAIRLDRQFKSAFYSTLHEVFSHDLQPTNGIHDVLESMCVPYCIATSSPPERAHSALSKTRLTHFFTDNIFTSHDVSRGKPAPDLFLHAAKNMGVEPCNCLVIEDSLSGIEGAIAANMQVIRYVGAAHLNHLKPNKRSDKTIHLSSWHDFYSLYPHLMQR